MTDFLPLAARRPAAPATAAGQPEDPKAGRARQAAVKLEASFLAEMLKAAGFGEQVNEFSGGTGEDQFASFYRMAVAERIAETGGLGLAEHFFRAMMERGNDQ